MRHKHLLLALSFIVFFTKVHAQLSGSYSVPGTFTSLGSAINSINISGISGPVTINIQAGHTETAVAGGYSLYPVVGSSSVNTVTFKKSGIGNNPVIFAYIGTHTPEEAVHDGVWRLIGADYVTIDGINITDNNSSTPATMEFGLGFFKAGTGNGCQNNTITNCVVSLKRSNDEPGVTDGIPGSCAIELANALPSTHTIQVVPVSAGGSHSYNRFYGNLLQNCNSGFGLNRVMIGSNNIAFADYNNDIGGMSAVTGNTIVNYGGGGNNITTKAVAIYIRGQYNINVSYNQINNNNGSGVNCLSPLYGIWSDVAPLASLSITNNTVTLKAGLTCYSGQAIYNDAGSLGLTNTVNISNNVITNCTNTQAYYGTFFGVINKASARQVVIAGNTFTNNSLLLYTANAAMIANYGLVTGSLTIENNQVSGQYNLNGPNSNSTSAVYATSSASAMVSCNNNTFTGMSLTGTVPFEYVKIANANNKLSVNNNSWLSINTGFNGPVRLIANYSQSDSAFTLHNNTVSNYTNTGASNGFTCYLGSNNTHPNCVSTYSGNVFSGITSTASGTGGFYGILSIDGYSPSYTRKLIFNNTISTIVYNSDLAYGIYAGNLGEGTFNLPSAIYNNTITAISGRYNVYGIGTNFTTSLTYAPLLYSNIINSISGTGPSGSSYGASISSGDGGLKFYKNKITDITNKSSATGIEISSGTGIQVFNNLVGAITSTATTNDAVAGIRLPYSSSDGKIYNNSVYLSGQVFGSSCVYNEFGKAELRNNILINNCIPTGTGVVAVYRDPNTSSFSVYSNLSDNNIFYAGTPGPNNALVIVGAATYTTMAQLKTSLGGRELNSVSENVAFNSTVTSAGNYLTVNPATATAVESGAIPVAWVADDYAGAARSASRPDIGAYEGNYTPSVADVQAPVVLSYRFNDLPCNAGGRSFTITLSDQTGVSGGTLSPKMYYKINSGAYASAAGSLISGTQGLGTWSFNMAYSVVVGDVVSWYLLAQDAAGNIATLPSSQSFTVASVNSVTAVSLVNTYSVQINLGGTYTVGAAGTFSTLTEAAMAYNNACLTGPVTFVLTNTLYSAPTETFPVLFTNNPHASQTNSLLIMPASGVNVIIGGLLTSAERAFIKMSGARFITIDGIGNGGSSITMDVSASSHFCADIWLASKNRNLSFNQLNITASGPLNHNSFGLLTAAENFTSYFSNTYYTASEDNDSISVTNCRFANLGYGIQAASNYIATSVSGNWNISNNYLGAAPSATNYLRYSGIAFTGAMSTVVSNTVSGIVNAEMDYQDQQNDVLNLIYGITVSGAKNKISKNIVSNLSTNQRATGMTINGSGRFSDMEVSNNMIIDLRRHSAFWSAHLTCLVLSGDRLKVNHNTLALTQGTYAASGPLINAPLIFPRTVEVDGTNITFNNNIVYNNIYRSAGGVINHGIFIDGNVNPFLQIDYNNYYLPGPDGYMANFNGNQVMSFSSFTNIVGGNQNSTLLPMAFMALNDAHLDPTSLVNYPFQNSGTPIAGITTDIDNQARSLTAPTIGADEFTSVAACNSATVANFSPATMSVCANNTIVLNGQGASTGIGLSLQWEQAPASAGTFTSVGYGSGSTSANFNPGALSPGVYYYRLTATCPSASLTGSSNVLTVTVNNPPSLTVTPTSYTVCAGQAATFTASGAVSYTWSTGSTASVIAVNPTAASEFYVSYRNPGCPAQVSNPLPVYFNLTPTISATAPSSFICNGGTATISASGANTYSWSTGETGSTINPTPTVTTVYTVTGQGSNNCSSIATRTVTVKATPTLSISGPTIICAGQSVTLVASGASSYTWNASVVSASLSAAPATSTVYNVTGRNSQGCSTSKAHSVQVNSSSGISISGPSLACQGETVTLTASGAATYSWSNGANTNSITVNPATTTGYTVTGGPAGCTASAVATVSINALPILSISGSSAICLGQSVSITAFGASNYTWSTGATGASFSDTPLASTNYSVTGTNSFGCAGSASLAVSVNTLPVLAILQSAATVCPGSAVTLTASGAATYTWSTGINLPVVTVTPSAASVYTVTGSSAQGCTASQTATININSLTPISILPPAATVCAQSAVSFTASGAATYTWSNGAGNLASASFTPFVHSIYTVTGTDAANGCVSSQTVGVTSNSLPAVSIFGPSSVCAGQSATLIAAGATNYVWNTSATTPFIAISPVSATSYFVVGTNNAGCSSSASLAVTSASVPVVGITPTSATVCASSTLALTASGAASYTWSTGDNGNAVTVSPAVATIYTVNGSNAAGCISGATVAVTTNSLPVISISPSSATVCAQSPVSFTASGATGFTWSNGGGNLSVAGFTPAGNSVYTVSGADALNGCISSKTVNVLVNPLPGLSVTGNTTICVGQATTLTPLGANSYSWVNTPVTGPIVVSPATSATYILGGTSTAGCVSFTTIAITTNSLPVITVAQSATTVCVFSPVTFTASGAGSYTWSVPGNANPITVNPSAPTIYTVSGSGNTGCVSSATVAVTTQSLPVIAVSPASATVCAQSSVSFSASGAATYSWSNNGGNLAQAGYTPATSTVYSVSGTDLATGCIASETVQVTVLALPQLAISGQTLICAGQQATLLASGAASYSWAGGQLTAGISVSPQTTTAYSVTGTGSNSCHTLASIQVSVIAVPVVVVNSGSICAGQVFTIIASGANTYTYSGGSNTVSPSSTTSYSITGVAANGCVSSSAISTVTVNSNPVIDVFSSEVIICKGKSATLTARGATTYTWDTSENTPEIAISPSVTTSYTVAGTDPAGCSASTVITQSVDECTAIKNIQSTATGSLRVYPNPNTGEFTVETLYRGTIVIYNVIGELIYESAIEDDTQLHSLINKANGVYFVHLRSENKSEVVRIIKN